MTLKRVVECDVCGQVRDWPDDMREDCLPDGWRSLKMTELDSNSEPTGYSEILAVCGQHDRMDWLAIVVRAQKRLAAVGRSS
jgi:hypothetical protein